MNKIKSRKSIEDLNDEQVLEDSADIIKTAFHVHDDAQLVGAVAVFEDEKGYFSGLVLFGSGDQDHAKRAFATGLLRCLRILTKEDLTIKGESDVH